jgi:hypothetical protein
MMLHLTACLWGTTGQVNMIIANETNEKFMDYEAALTEIENNFVAENNVKEDIHDTEEVEIIEANDENTLENNENTLENNENQ